MRTPAVLIAVLATALLTSASTPGDVTGDGVTDAEDLTCVNATIYDEDAGCAVATAAYVRTVVVSPVPGDTSASGDALLAAMAGISGASQTNPYLLKLEPGVYDLGTGQLITKQWVDIEGAGEDVTWIMSGGSNLSTLQLTSNCEIRLLTIAHNGGSMLAVAVETLPGDLGDRRTLRHVRIRASAGSSDSTGVWAQDSITMKDCSIEVTGSASALGAYLATRSFLRDTSILAKDAATCKGLDIYDTNGTMLRGLEIVAEWGADCTGIHNRESTTNILGSRVFARNCSNTNTAIDNNYTLSLHIQDSYIFAWVGYAGRGTGLKNTNQVTVTVVNSTVGADGFNGPLLAVENFDEDAGPWSVWFNDSVIVQDVVNDDSFFLGFGSCQFRWTTFTGTGTTRCLGCYDEDFQNSAGWTSCPP